VGQGLARDNADFFLFRFRKYLGRHALIQQVKDHLQGVDPGVVQSRKRFSFRMDRNADKTDLPCCFNPSRTSMTSFFGSFPAKDYEADKDRGPRRQAAEDFVHRQADIFRIKILLMPGVIEIPTDLGGQDDPLPRFSFRKRAKRSSLCPSPVGIGGIIKNSTPADHAASKA